jgi:hypothetical protein
VYDDARDLLLFSVVWFNLFDEHKKLL